MYDASKAHAAMRKTNLRVPMSQQRSQTTGSMIHTLFAYAYTSAA
jgi:hypothetical protein